MKRLFALFALAIFFLVPLAHAVGGRVHSVTLTGRVRVVLPIGWENVSSTPRAYEDPSTAPRVIGWRGTIQVSDTQSFANVLWSSPVFVPDVALLTSTGGALPDGLVPAFDGTLNYGGTSGCLVSEPGNWVKVRTQFFTQSDTLYTRVVGQHFEDPDPGNPNNAWGAIPTGGAHIDVRSAFVDRSQLNVIGLPSP